jgi:hypothetical protein
MKHLKTPEDVIEHCYPELHLKRFVTRRVTPETAAISAVPNVKKTKKTSGPKYPEPAPEFVGDPPIKGD